MEKECQRKCSVSLHQKAESGFSLGSLVTDPGYNSDRPVGHCCPPTGKHIKAGNTGKEEDFENSDAED